MLLALLTSARATLVAAALDPAALAVLSDATVFGDVVDVRNVWEGGRIWTVATLDLVDLDESADVWIPGGCIAGVCLTVAGAPWVEPGERVFVFLNHDRPTSLAQGLFHVRGDVALREFRGLTFLDGERPAPAVPLAELLTLQPRVGRED